MTRANHEKRLGKQVDIRVKRLQKAEQERPTLLAQTVYLGVLGLIFVLPVVGGAYLGLWLDGLQEGYSVRWTLGMILLGLVVGAINVWLYIRE